MITAEIFDRIKTGLIEANQAKSPIWRDFVSKIKFEDFSQFIKFSQSAALPIIYDEKLFEDFIIKIADSFVSLKEGNFDQFKNITIKEFLRFFPKLRLNSEKVQDHSEYAINKIELSQVIIRSLENQDDLTKMSLFLTPIESGGLGFNFYDINSIFFKANHSYGIENFLPRKIKVFSDNIEFLREFASEFKDLWSNIKIKKDYNSFITKCFIVYNSTDMESFLNILKNEKSKIREAITNYRRKDLALQNIFGGYKKGREAGSASLAVAAPAAPALNALSAVAGAELDTHRKLEELQGQFKELQGQFKELLGQYNKLEAENQEYRKIEEQRRALPESALKELLSKENKRMAEENEAQRRQIEELSLQVAVLKELNNTLVKLQEMLMAEKYANIVSQQGALPPYGFFMPQQPPAGAAPSLHIPPSTMRPAEEDLSMQPPPRRRRVGGEAEPPAGAAPALHVPPSTMRPAEENLSIQPPPKSRRTDGEAVNAPAASPAAPSLLPPAKGAIYPGEGHNRQ